VTSTFVPAFNGIHQVAYAEESIWLKKLTQAMMQMKQWVKQSILTKECSTVSLNNYNHVLNVHPRNASTVFINIAINFG
jgi:hypothetical protein